MATPFYIIFLFCSSRFVVILPGTFLISFSGTTFVSTAIHAIFARLVELPEWSVVSKFSSCVTAIFSGSTAPLHSRPGEHDPFSDAVHIFVYAKCSRAPDDRVIPSNLVGSVVYSVTAKLPFPPARSGT